jgi:hypothetical protein
MASAFEIEKVGNIGRVYVNPETGIKKSDLDKKVEDNKVVTYRPAFHVAHSLKEVLLTDPTPVALADYNKKDFTEFNRVVREVQDLINSRGNGYLYLNDLIRYGSGGFYLISAKEGDFLILVQRTPDAPRMPNFLDGSFGLGSYYVPTYNGVAEIGEEVSILTVTAPNLVRETVVNADGKMLIPSFDENLPDYKLVNGILEKSAIEAAKPVIGNEPNREIVHVHAELVLLKNSSEVVINGHQSSHKANVSFERASIEFAVGIVKMDLTGYSIDDIVLLDTEFFNGNYLARKTLCIDTSTGKTRVYQNGNKVGEIPLAKYVKDIMRDGNYCTSKVMALQEDWPDSLSATWIRELNKELTALRRV